MEPLMTLEDVAKYLKVNRLTVYKYVREKGLPVVRVRKSYRVRPNDLEAWVKGSRS